MESQSPSASRDLESWIVESPSTDYDLLLSAANSKMDVHHILSEVGCDPAAISAEQLSRKLTSIRAAEAMIELQQVQSECVTANCGLSPYILTLSFKCALPYLYMSNCV